ncbi:hypothetical protein X769_31810 [Mesorhizobium sp. LSJC268A00]|nr:hypothetical protein X769_31810 [Mesorhizobium sp. LSJC268A00]
MPAPRARNRYVETEVLLIFSRSDPHREALLMRQAQD